MDRGKQVCSFLAKFRNDAIRARTEEPDLLDLPDQTFEQEKLVYGNVSELVLDDTLESLGKHVVTVSYYDTNLFHNILSGRSVTGTLNFLNKTLTDCYSNKKSTVETATHSSEHSYART